MDLWILSLREKELLGGSGSGNFGHEGRPGEVGGSGSGGPGHISNLGKDTGWNHSSGWHHSTVYGEGHRDKTPEFGYHMTDVENLESIAEKGLLAQGTRVNDPDAVAFVDKLFPKGHEAAMENQDPNLVTFKVAIPKDQIAYDDAEVREFSSTGGSPNHKLGTGTAFFIRQTIPPENIKVVIPGSRKTVSIHDYVKSLKK